jgi:hypothetical protein
MFAVLTPQTTTRNLLRVSTDLVLERNKLAQAEAPTTAATGLTPDGRLRAFACRCGVAHSHALNSGQRNSLERSGIHPSVAQPSRCQLRSSFCGNRDAARDPTHG